MAHEKKLHETLAQAQPAATIERTSSSSSYFKQTSNENIVEKHTTMHEITSPSSSPESLSLGMEKLAIEQEQEPREKSNPQACLFVASLAASRTDAELQESVEKYFKTWGPITNVKVMRDYMGRPFGFVQFKSTADAHKAMKEAQNAVLDGRHIRIEQAKVNRTLFLAKLDRALGEKEIKAKLEEYGPIEELTLLHHPTTGQFKGCGFVKYSYRDDAMDAYNDLKQEEFCNVDWAENLERGKSSDQDRNSIFVGQLNAGQITQELLEERFGVYGEIESATLFNRQPTGPMARPAFAFIKYKDPSSADEAIKHENAEVWLDRTIRVQHRERAETRHGRAESGGLAFEAPKHARQGTYDLPPEFYGPSYYGQPMMYVPEMYTTGPFTTAPYVTGPFPYTTTTSPAYQVFQTTTGPAIQVTPGGPFQPVETHIPMPYPMMYAQPPLFRPLFEPQTLATSGETPTYAQAPEYPAIPSFYGYSAGASGETNPRPGDPSYYYPGGPATEEGRVTDAAGVNVPAYPSAYGSSYSMMNMPQYHDGDST